MPASHSTLVWAGRGRGGEGRGGGVGGEGEGQWIMCTGSHLPLSHHDMALGDVDTSQTVSRRLEEHSQTILQTCPVHTKCSASAHTPPPHLLIPPPCHAPPSHPSTSPYPTLSFLHPTPHLPLSLDVALQVLVRVSRDWTQSMEFEGLRLCAPLGHCLDHLQGREGSNDYQGSTTS